MVCTRVSVCLSVCVVLCVLCVLCVCVCVCVCLLCDDGMRVGVACKCDYQCICFANHQFLVLLVFTGFALMLLMLL